MPQASVYNRYNPDDASPDEEPPLYAKQRRIYPQAVRGNFRRAKWIILCLTLGIYYLLPFVRWDRGPHAPHQAVLVDFPARRFYFFAIEIWPQEVYYLTGLLILAALFLFLSNAVAGRVWCGYLCPQTVWTDLFYAVERWVEGDRRERMRQDVGKWTFSILRQKLLKHGIWILIAWWTGGAWVLYFSDAPTLVRDLATLQAPATAWIWIGILTATTYTLAGFMREQVCTYMCPWPRIQAALTDEHALNVTYRYDRGEPRGSFKKTEIARAAGLSGGDCVDCQQCVFVCPTGVDIRNGLQLDCIQCGLCIDACDAVMQKVGRPSGLISYDTDINIARRKAGAAPVFKIIRPRTLLYVGLILLVASLMAIRLFTRDEAGIGVLHDRSPLYVRLSDGSIRNGYSIRIANKKLEPRQFTVSVDGLQDSRLELVGVPVVHDRQVVSVDPDQTREIRALVTVPSHRIDRSSRDIWFRLTDTISGETIVAADHFRVP
ncbi:MAG: cytochrome c oxidase accessory protein CcoG [Oxalobacteraceae bacterium]|nr:MAG: cytochrome c oxidase accessory protein CcoG [Oxalobacteraceae bacterium]